MSIAVGPFGGDRSWGRWIEASEAAAPCLRSSPSIRLEAPSLMPMGRYGPAGRPLAERLQWKFPPAASAGPRGEHRRDAPRGFSALREILRKVVCRILGKLLFANKCHYSANEISDRLRGHLGTTVKEDLWESERDKPFWIENRN
ncbi:Hypothetical protein NTJ_06014 [Nesidiocoris tenuis]|uniref:Uncharacterized protein n=1 Tax=Nesidiocoris tenuis TaxID=355587 RepID=A0ABN7ALU8_9HEMI|nr:Hypothetical protein NTJ_06014 [Nesidiocoris tenuis]